MTHSLDLKDIQGNITRGYGFDEFTQMFVTIKGNPGNWKDFLGDLAGVVTSAECPRHGSSSAINVGISYAGLQKLHPASAPGLEDDFPAFYEGMQGRASALGDPDDIDWNVWAQRDVWITFHGRNRGDVDQAIVDVEKLAARRGIVLDPSIHQKGDYRHGSSLRDAGKRIEHFGFTDGKANPVFEGAVDPMRLRGNGKRDDRNGWQPIATGEFLLGHPNEQGQDVVAALDASLQAFLKNGTFAVLRVLEQDVKGFLAYVERKSTPPGRLNLTASDLAEGMMGRTRDGRALAAPGREDFDYRVDDPAGAKCPLGAHVRRANPRTGGEHRLLRRSVTYGGRYDPDKPTDERRGMYFIAMNASIESQFEFIQRSYLNGEAGGQLKTGNLQGAQDPLAATGKNDRKMVIEGDEASGRAPVVLLDVPPFVSCRGGQYYLMPSKSGLRAIARRDATEWNTLMAVGGIG